MKNEKAELLDSSGGSPREGIGGSPWSPEVTELLDHLAVELALEYVRLMEQAAEDEASTHDETREGEDAAGGLSNGGRDGFEVVAFTHLSAQLLARFGIRTQRSADPIATPCRRDAGATMALGPL